MNEPSPERLWRRRANSVSKRLNVALWLERFNVLSLAGVAVVAVGLLIWRTWRPASFDESAFRLTMVSVGLLFVILAFLSWLLVRHRFVQIRDGLVRLDDTLGFNNRLISAFCGVGEWPGFVRSKPDVAIYPWNKVKAGLPLLISVSLVALAVWVPIPDGEAVGQIAPVEPGAWEQMEDWIDLLAGENLVQEAALEEISEKIEELRDQPEEDWFSHSSLEATDSLEESLAHEIRDLSEGLAALDRDITSLQSFSSEMSESAREAAMREFDEALESLSNAAGMPLNEDLLKQLQEIDSSQLGSETMGSMSIEQLEALQSQLRKGSGALGSMQGLAAISPLAQEGMPGVQPGQGGVNRGKGDAPLYYGEDSEDLKTNKVEAVSNSDFSKATVGELIGTGETEREIERLSGGAVAGGGIGSLGKGGEAVFRQTLLPDEQAVLKRYFK